MPCLERRTGEGEFFKPQTVDSRNLLAKENPAPLRDESSKGIKHRDQTLQDRKEQGRSP